jgi:hypothetical protein
MRLDLLTNASIDDDAMKFVEKHTQQQSSNNNNNGNNNDET